MKLLRFYPLLLTALLQVMPLARVVLTDPLPAAPGASILFKWAVGAFALMGGLHAVAGASANQNLINSPTNATGTNGVGFRYRITSVEPRTQNYNATPLPPGLFINGAAGVISNSYILGTPTNFVGTMNVTLSISYPGWPTESTNLALTIVSRPIITNQPQSRAILSGGSNTFTIGAYGSPTMIYQWYSGQSGTTNPVPNATNSTLILTNVTQSSNYFAVITNLYGRSTSSLASLTVATTPVITTPPANTTTNTGSNATFAVTATGGSLSYQWRTNGVNFLASATNATLVVSNVPSAYNGYNFDVVVTNLAGRATSSPPAVLTVLFRPVILTNPVNLIRTVGTTGTFSIAVSANPAPGYQWRKSTVALPGQTNSTLTLENIQTADGGSYDVVVTNSLGSTNSSAATLTVLIPPSITNSPASRTNLVGTTATLTVGASGFPAPSYIWRRNGTNVSNGGNISGATTATLTMTGVQLTNAASYIVIVSNSVGVATSAPPAVLTVHAAPAITVTPTNRTIIAGSNTTFTVTATGTPAPGYQWRSNGVDIVGETTSSLALTNVPAAFNGSSFVVVVTNAAGSVTSAPPAVLTVLFAPNLTAQPTNLTVNAGSPAAFAVTAEGNPAPAYQWRRDGTNLAGATGATFNLASAQATNAGSYDVVVTNSQGSVTSVVATLTVNVTIVAPGITSPPTNLTVVAGNAAAFSVTASGTPPLAYQWRKDGADLNNETNVTLVINAASTNDAGSYEVVVANSGGSVTSAPPAVLTVLVRPSITSQPLALARFVGQNATFSVDAAGSGPLHFQWRHGTPGATNNGDIAGATNTSLVLTNLTTNHAGNYRVVVTNAAGSTGSVQVTLTVAPLPLLQTLGLQGKNALMGLNVSPALPYNIEYATDATNRVWLPLTNLPVQSVATNLTFPDAITNDTRRFYRVISP
ncbi:MAG: immunoglobulin domain-containing protein [Verrucomicrobia bacterium]|nr:immunoglobulin domain-containing protein [Verrucomicrobiota bacterium]